MVQAPELLIRVRISSQVAVGRQRPVKAGVFQQPPQVAQVVGQQAQLDYYLMRPGMMTAQPRHFRGRFRLLTRESCAPSCPGHTKFVSTAGPQRQIPDSAKMIYLVSGLREQLYASCHLLGLLWAMEEAHVYGLGENMPLDRFHYVCASLEGVSPGLDIDLRV